MAYLTGLSNIHSNPDWPDYNPDKRIKRADERGSSERSIATSIK
jgi:hypothetical protein